MKVWTHYVPFISFILRSRYLLRILKIIETKGNIASNMLQNEAIMLLNA